MEYDPPIDGHLHIVTADGVDCTLEPIGLAGLCEGDDDPNAEIVIVTNGPVAPHRAHSGPQRPRSAPQPAHRAHSGSRSAPQPAHRAHSGPVEPHSRPTEPTAAP